LEFEGSDRAFKFSDFSFHVQIPFEIIVNEQV
jgi:hypothetical protein